MNFSSPFDEVSLNPSCDRADRGDLADLLGPTSLTQLMAPGNALECNPPPLVCTWGGFGQLGHGLCWVCRLYDSGYPLVMQELRSVWGIHIPQTCSPYNGEPVGATC